MADPTSSGQGRAALPIRRLPGESHEARLVRLMEAGMPRGRVMRDAPCKASELEALGYPRQRHDKGGWNEARPRCLGCGKNDRPHMAKCLCASCYRRGGVPLAERPPKEERLPAPIETQAERIVRLYRRWEARGRSPLACSTAVRQATKLSREEVEEALLSAGISVARRPSHPPLSIAARVMRLWERHEDKPEARRARCVAHAVGGVTSERVREILRANGVPVASPDRRAPKPPREPREPKPRKAKAPPSPKPAAPKPTPKPIVTQSPKRAVIRAEYRDDAPCRMVDPRETWGPQPQTVRFVPVEEIFAGRVDPFASRRIKGLEAMGRGLSEGGSRP